MKNYFIDKNALVSKSAKIGKGTKIWAFAQVGENARIGENCVIGNGVYVDRNVIIGNNVKIHNKALLYDGLIVEDNCFIGPGACFTNDKFPRHNTTRNLIGKTWRIGNGAIIGANSTVLPDLTIGKNAVIGAGSVVTKSIPNNVTAYGNPAKVIRIDKKNKLINLSKCIKSSANWILNSGLQSKNGGFYAWFDRNTKKYSYLYSEITGYGITTLLFINRIAKTREAIKKAEYAASWIINESLQPCGGVKTGKGEANNLFTFDTGMVLYGMINLFKATRKDRYLQVSKKIAEFLLRNQRKDGSIAAIYSPKTNKTLETFDKWSNQSGAFHAKIALGLVDLYEVTSNQVYKDAAIKLCNFTLTLQDKTGRFITNKADNTTHIHPHCYAAEGLFYTGVHFRIKKFIIASQKASKWSFDNLSNYGINELYNPLTNTFNDFQRSDILAQLLRLGIIFSLDSKKIDELASLLLTYQYKEGSRQDGGFLYSKNERHLNSWCTMFTLQALDFYNNKNSAKNHGACLPARQGSTFSGKKIELFI